MEIEDYRVIGFICDTDFRHELGHAGGGVSVYSSLKDIKKHCGCAESCGVVKIECRHLETALEGDHDGIGSEDVENKTPKYIEYQKKYIEHLRMRAAFFEEQAKTYLVLANRSEAGLLTCANNKAEIKKDYLNRIAAACGNPDPAEGCRVVIRLVEEAKKSIIQI